MGKHKQDYDESEIDSFIPLSILDTSISKIIKCEDSETHYTLCCLIKYNIDKYFKDCLKESKRSKKKKNRCEFDTTYYVIGEDDIDEDDEEDEDEDEFEE